MPEASFTSLSPAEQRARLRPAEAFPVMNVVYSEKDRVLLLTAQHFKTSTVVQGIPKVTTHSRPAWCSRGPS